MPEEKYREDAAIKHAIYVQEAKIILVPPKSEIILVLSNYPFLIFKNKAKAKM